MNEKILTDAQISRRKTWAIVLIGIGLIIIPLLRIYLRKRMDDHVIDDVTYARYLGWLLFFVLLSLIVAWISISKFLDKGKTNFIKHWIIAIVCMRIFSKLLIHFIIQINPAVVWDVEVLMDILFFTYMISSIDNARKNSEDPAVQKAVRIIQSVLVAIILARANWLVLFSLYSSYQEPKQLIQLSNFMGLLSSSVLPVILFLGEIKLIRSSLFASTASQVEEYARCPKARTSFLNAVVCGTIAGVILCAGLTFVVTKYWNSIYYNLV